MLSNFIKHRCIYILFLCILGLKYEPEIIEEGYKVYMKLRINYLEMNDYGIYKCISKNAVADMEGSINIYSTYLHICLK